MINMRIPTLAEHGLLAAMVPGGRARIQEQIDLENAMMRMAACCRPDQIVAAKGEAVRRQTELGMTEQNSYDSVTDDLMKGRWRP